MSFTGSSTCGSIVRRTVSFALTAIVSAAFMLSLTACAVPGKETRPVSPPSPPPIRISLSQYYRYSPDRDYSEGDVFFFGNYEQDNDMSDDSELIKWRVLRVDSDRMLVLSEKILDARQYHSDHAQGAPWQSSDLRRWLNGEFYERAFSDSDKAHVMKCVNPYYKNPEFPGVAGSETTDYVFCLSILEAEDYLLSSYVSLLAEPTAYAKAKIISANPSPVNPADVITDPDARRPWWLRTNGWDLWLASIIHEEDRISYRGRVVTAEDVGVRPAIFLELN